MSTFDVFLSHNSIDKPWVSQLKDDLGRYGVKVWLDKDEIRPGDLFARALEEGLDDSRTVALVISPEAMASGWVKEEYYRALSLCNNKGQSLILIPVILRNAELPGFAQSRNWVDFRDEAQYGQNIWKLVWGITGVKPAEVLDLTGPAIPPPVPPPAAVAPEPQPAQPPGFQSGGVKVGGKIQAENIVTGVQVQGAEAETARRLLEAARQIKSGGVEAGQDIMAKNIVTGFQYLGRGGDLTRAQFEQELAALREQLSQAIAAREIEDEYEAEDAQQAIDRAIEQTQAASDNLAAGKITRQLEKAAAVIEAAAKTAESTKNFGATVIKLAPVVLGLAKMAQLFF